MNPTNAVFEERIAELEGGVAALGLASGQASSAYAIQNLCSHGDNFVASSHLYGGTYNQFKNPFSDMGIEVRFVDPSDPQNFLDATDDKTRAYYGEVLPNPSFLCTSRLLYAWECRWEKLGLCLKPSGCASNLSKTSWTPLL